jgi:hypothetical protein
MIPFFSADNCTLYHGDCLEVLRKLPADSVDLIFGSPPYEDARTYGIDFALKGQDWVDWMAERWTEFNRVCRGLVAMVVEGKTKQFQWSATPALLMADLHRAGVKLRKPPAFHRVGIPGSGGPDWLRNDYEFIVCSSRGKLPWSENTAMGHDPIYPPGGPPSHRTTATRGSKNGDTRVQGAVYKPPAKANPGNVIHCKVGGGLMGHPLAHENEAPFPESLAEFFVRSFCPHNGIVLDPFAGSGTTLAVADRTGRKSIGIEVRQSQLELCIRRTTQR